VQEAAKNSGRWSESLFIHPTIHPSIVYYTPKDNIKSRTMQQHRKTRELHKLCPE